MRDLTLATVHGWRGMIADNTGFAAAGMQTRELTEAYGFPAVPLTVISASDASVDLTEQAGREHLTMLHTRRAASSPCGRHVVALRSGHMVPLDEPNVIVAEVRAVLDARCGRREESPRPRSAWETPTLCVTHVPLQRPGHQPASDHQARLTAMADEKGELTLGRVSSESVREATGRGWEEWLEALDAVEAADWDHKEIVAYLEREHREVSSWWRQSITVGYEQARGKRIVGETADVGFQVGVQRSVAATVTEVWELITSRPELWLGEGASVTFDKGERYAVLPGHGAPGVSGEVRVVKPGDRLRMTWQPQGWPAPATLQLALSASGSGKTAIHAHLEKLPDADVREAMRKHWREALERICRGGFLTAAELRSPAGAATGRAGGTAPARGRRRHGPRRTG